LLPRDVFTFDPANNHFICPQGKILKHRTARKETRIHTYRATASDCKECPIRPECTRGTKRALSVPFDEAARQRAMALYNTEEFRQSRRLRRKVEMLFAHMKQQFRFTRLKLRGLAGAAEEFLLVATVQNPSPCAPSPAKHPENIEPDSRLSKRRRSGALPKGSPEQQSVSPAKVAGRKISILSAFSLNSPAGNFNSRLFQHHLPFSRQEAARHFRTPRKTAISRAVFTGKDQ
jgi:hypothetical protein